MSTPEDQFADLTTKPAVGGMGGSIHDWIRGGDPFHHSCAPSEHAHAFRQGSQRMGWLALDWCGNIIGFKPDGE